ncbi:hypothetical protein HYH02_009267 [Chlamydomonas schloesseri]|uniref:Uncharacterized protein n=1 Tax=Chlamydomonas schloesseri TaxID=2026947 RepID=A0A835TQ26_9CHLO|nr:hypothetical protein HYH02_009267 [Chlamydomonas schloesseri]|eukprot:KAG2443190.1 hypothetical protein HYH02_009267 [Chlamydomonas schloesseri]
MLLCRTAHQLRSVVPTWLLLDARRVRCSRGLGLRECRTGVVLTAAATASPAYAAAASTAIAAGSKSSRLLSVAGDSGGGGRAPAAVRRARARVSARSSSLSGGSGSSAASAAADFSDASQEQQLEQTAQQQQQQAARVRAFLAAATARVLPNTTAEHSSRREPPPAPPPLPDLPGIVPATWLHPLLEWVTSAAMRPVAVQSILEQHCSRGVRRIVAAAAQLAATEEAAFAGKPDDKQDSMCVTSAHLALAALADDDDPDCAAALGVLHHSAAALSLPRCAELLAERAAEERRREEELHGHGSSSSSASGSSSNSSSSSMFSSPALHFLFQAYRWAVFMGCDQVQPCHLLWALAADPRTCYSALLADPLDGRVAAAEVREPPLVWLLQRCPEALPRPAAVYEQVTKSATAAATAAAVGGGGAGASSSSGGGGRVAAIAAIHQELAAGLNALATAFHTAGGTSPPLPVGGDLADLAALLRACRLAGHVPSRRQLAALGAALAAGLHGGEDPDTFCMDVGDERWLAIFELAEGFAALGFEPDPAGSMLAWAPHDVGLAPAAPAAGLCDRVLAWSRTKAAMDFCYPRSEPCCELTLQRLVVDEASVAEAVARPAALQQALLAVAGTPPSDIPTWRSGVRGSVSNRTQWRYSIGDAGAAAAALRQVLPVPVRAQLLRSLCEGGPRVQFPYIPADFPAVGLRTALATSLASDDCSSIHATLDVQQVDVARAYAAAGICVPEGWLRQLASYSDDVAGLGGGDGGEVATALRLMLRAAVGAAAAGDGDGATGATSGAAATAATAAAAAAGIPSELVGQLAAMLQAAADAGRITPAVALQTLLNLLDGAQLLPASAGPTTTSPTAAPQQQRLLSSIISGPARAILMKAAAAASAADASRDSQAGAGLDGGVSSPAAALLPALMRVLDVLLVRCGDLPSLALGSREQQLQALTMQQGGEQQARS